MDSPPPDWTPLGIAIGGVTIAGILRWIAIRLLLISPTRAALEKLTKDQREFHDTVMADMKTLHDAMGAMAGHQEADGVRIAVLQEAVKALDAARHDG